MSLQFLILVLKVQVLTSSLLKFCPQVTNFFLQMLFFIFQFLDFMLIFLILTSLGLLLDLFRIASLRLMDGLIKCLVD